MIYKCRPRRRHAIPRREVVHRRLADDEQRHRAGSCAAHHRGLRLTPRRNRACAGQAHSQERHLEPVKAGRESVRTVTINSTQPFRITSIQGADQELIVRPVSNDSRTRHDLILQTFPTQPDRPGEPHDLRPYPTMSTNADIEFNAQQRRWRDSLPCEVMLSRSCRDRRNDRRGDGADGRRQGNRRGRRAARVMAAAGAVPVARVVAAAIVPGGAVGGVLALTSSVSSTPPVPNVVQMAVMEVIGVAVRVLDSLCGRNSCHAGASGFRESP